MRHRLLAGAACALAAHALIYRSPLPADGAHGYFRWYEPLVACLSLVALGSVAFALAAATCARVRGRTFLWLAPQPLGAAFAELFATTMLILLAQETLEQSIASGRPAPAAFAAATWPVVLLAVAACAFALVVARRLVQAAVQRLLGVRPPRAYAAADRWAAVVYAARRMPALASLSASRGPPLVAG